MNDIYHNAIWMKKEQNGEQKDELVWLKYPHNALISGLPNAQTLGWIDTDREFQYQVPFATNQRTGSVFKMDGFAVAVNSYSSIDYTYVTKDGCRWKRLSDNPNVGNVNAFKFATNGICNISGSYLNVTRFIEEEETEAFSLDKRSIAIGSSGCRYICSTQDGCIVGREEAYNVQVSTGLQTRYKIYMYHITENGSENVFYEDDRRYSIFGFPRECTRGSYSAFVVSTRYRYYRDNRADYDTYRNCYYAYVSMDNGHTWQVQELFYRDSNMYGRYPYIIDKLDVAIRDDYMVALISNGATKETKIFTTLTQTWTEVELPSWVDLPLLQGGGKCIATNPSYETIRIAIRPNETANANTTIYDMMRTINSNNYSSNMNGGLNNIRCQDGEIVDDDEYLLIGDYNIKAYFDNFQLVASSKAFAYMDASFDSTDGAETVQPNDYVVR